MSNQQLFSYTNLAAFRRRRLEKGFSAPQLAAELHMSPRVTRRLENSGECAPKKFARLCEFLDLQVSYFLPDDLQMEDYEEAHPMPMGVPSVKAGTEAWLQKDREKSE